MLLTQNEAKPKTVESEKKKDRNRRIPSGFTNVPKVPGFLLKHLAFILCEYEQNLRPKQPPASSSVETVSYLPFWQEERH